MTDQRPLPEHLNQAVEQYRQGRIEEARNTFNDCLTSHPDHVDLLHLYATFLTHNQDCAQAVELLSRALRIRPNDPGLLTSLGSSYQAQGLLNEAVVHLQHALSIQPNGVEANIRMGEILVQKGQHGEAIGCLHTALSFQPDHVEAHFLLSNAYHLQGKQLLCNCHAALYAHFQDRQQSGQPPEKNPWNTLFRMMDKTIDDRQIIANCVLTRRFYVNSHVYRVCNGLVKHGPFAGMKILESSSWGCDKAGKLLGFYEAELLQDLCSVLAETDNIFIDIGAADGYYAIGSLIASLTNHCIAYELTENGRRITLENAKQAGVEDRLTIRGACDVGFAHEILAMNRKNKQIVILCDIEGFEFEIFTPANLALLKEAILFIEIHDSSPEAQEKYRLFQEHAAVVFDLKVIRIGPRDPYRYREMDELNDTDHWLACSEGRNADMKWLRLMPRRSQV